MESVHKKVGEVLAVPCNRIRPFKKQPRHYFERTSLQSLRESIEKQGQIEPALVKRIPRGTSNYDFELIAGERRWRACRTLGIDLRVTVVEVSGYIDQFALAVTSNSGEPLTPMETAYSLHELRESPQVRELPRQEQVAAIARIFFSRSSQWAWERWGLVRLRDDLQALVEPQTEAGKRIPVKIAASLAGLPHECQMPIWQHVQRKKMTVSRAKTFITKFKRRSDMIVRGRLAPDEYIRFRRMMLKTREELDSFLDKVPGGDFQAGIATRTPEELELLADSVQDVIELYRRLLAQVIEMPGQKKAS